MPARLLAGAPLPDPQAGGILVLAVGKAAAGMAQAIAGRIPGADLRGLVIAPQAAPVDPRLAFAIGSHPVPDAASEAAGRRALELADSCDGAGTLLVLVSGGASALMAVPAEGMTLADKREATATLLRAGADIHALNAVRKHLSAVKGGWLAARCRGRTIALAISDVVGDDLSVIGSGPTVPDPSTFADALAVLDRFGGRAAYPARVLRRLERGAAGDLPETPKPGDPRLARATTRVIGGRREAMAGAAAEAAARGYHVVTLDAPVVGEARTAAPRFVAAAAAAAGARPACVIAGGETTVHVTGRGRGGRNQEFALAAAGALAPLGAAVVASAGTDGIDGPTDAAGAVADLTTLPRAGAAGLPEVQAVLAANDSHPFFAALGDLIRLGPTGTNVGDLQVFLLA